jgi:Putative prokaryotic signal transducing protein
MADDTLICPNCARAHLSSERFCEACGMPLVQPGGREPAASERQRRARKIKPQYAEGKLVKVARAANQPEAEFIEGLLLEEGIPCMLRRSAGFDVAESLAAGPRDVLVPESGAEAAREALAWEGRVGGAG